MIRQRPCDGPEKPCRKPTFEDRSNRQGGMCTNSLNHVNYSTPGTNVSGSQLWCHYRRWNHAPSPTGWTYHLLNIRKVKTAPGAYRGFYANVRDAINGVAEQAVKAEDGEAGGDGYGEFEEGSDIEGGV